MLLNVTLQKCRGVAAGWGGNFGLQLSRFPRVLLMKTNQTQTPHHGGHHCLLLMCTTYYRAVKKIQKIMAMPAVRAAKWSAVEFTCRRRRHKRWRFDPCVGKIPWGRKCYPLQCSCLENSMDRGAWQPTVRGVAKGQTRLSS